MESGLYTGAFPYDLEEEKKEMKASKQFSANTLLTCMKRRECLSRSRIPAENQLMASFIFSHQNYHTHTHIHVFTFTIKQFTISCYKRAVISLRAVRESLPVVNCLLPKWLHLGYTYTHTGQFMTWNSVLFERQ